ncbi:hypothetical protein M231_00559 [Tremella mesenterica]|uniref:Uncharacterized protein n=1 Tax=Tremella mesenterica TaxID=5217 RepID=A0A4Q1BVP2_TREME|nr:hypothetical protein M231_00559 [Tremella mesenterica]
MHSNTPLGRARSHNISKSEDPTSLWKALIKSLRYGPDQVVEMSLKPRVNIYTPGEIASLEAVQAAQASAAAAAASSSVAAAKASASAAAAAAAAAAKAKTATTAKTTASTTAKAAAGNAAAGTTIKSAQLTATNPVIASIQAAASSSTISSSSSTTSTISSVSKTTTSSSSTSKSSSSTSSTHSSSPTPTVPTITSNFPSSTLSSAIKSATAEAAASSSKNSGLSTGGIVGVVVAALIGLIIVGSAIGWLYRKYARRSYSTKLPWSKIPEDITPYPHEKPEPPPDDIYGSSTVPVIGSRRALALARQNAFNNDGTLRPDSYVGEDNRAGVGAGTRVQPRPQPQPGYGGYGTMAPSYGVDAQGRPYNAQAGRVPINPYPYTDDYTQPPAFSPPSSRQLLGPNSPPTPAGHPFANSNLLAVPMGRPLPPRTASDIDNLEDFADIPQPHSPNYLPYSDPEPYTPRTATSANEWAGHVQAPMPPPAAATSMPMPKPYGYPLAEKHTYSQPTSSNYQSNTETLRAPLPTLTPVSPLMASFNLRNSTQQPLAMYEPEHTPVSPPSTPSDQKRLYGEVARAAGVSEPVTPVTPAAGASALNHSTSSQATTSSFSAHEPMRLPQLNLEPPQPYMHGQPLSPLQEVPTPLSTATNVSQQAGRFVRSEVNPFDRMPNSADSRNLVPPYSATTAGATVFPSPHYPPPSPGGMSVPGSVTDSPRRWSGAPGNRVSMFDGDDAYGGI